jgi:transposase InsO family protein
VTADQRRQAVRQLQDTFGVSQRRACRVVGQHRSAQRQRPRTKEDEPRLVQRMLELVRQHPRFGYRRIWVLLRREGWRVNRKRVERLWRREGLKVPRKRRKKRRLGSSANGCVRRRALHKDHVWAWDFIHDRTADGRALKWLTLVDEYTRECLLLEVARSITARKAVALVADVIRQRGAPAHVRSDNGPEFIAQAMRAWLAGAGVATLCIEPGSPWENGYAESFNSKVRDEFLATEEFASELEARVLGRQWKQGYNHDRPHSALGYRTPAEYAIGCPRPDSSALRPDEDTTVTMDPTLTPTGP